MGGAYYHPSLAGLWPPSPLHKLQQKMWKIVEKFGECGCCGGGGLVDWWWWWTGGGGGCGGIAINIFPRNCIHLSYIINCSKALEIVRRFGLRSSFPMS